MSDEFDKEAEREKLEEKYERDKQKRQATEQMSELLLQGATMTNAHCSECGDPIFRYEEQEFCPTCEKPVDRETQSDDEEDSEDDDSIQVTTPSNDARVSFGQSEEGEQPAENGQATSDQPVNEETPQQPRQPANRQTEPPQQTQQTGTQNQPAQPTQPPASPQASQQAGAEPGVAAARESLVQTLTRFSQQAAAADDPARAQEHLAAAREAAEALAALRQ
ncbi:Sjogren's syndrome/scleroderma autoantigen 1 family protein [Halovenus halobia]|uniref:Sjogren's syndrome/scleroderma autoantigen 1 family protein n=1 Tax=Halovenus halobia TaxID=3396622 RepID=UPI003F56284F